MIPVLSNVLCQTRLTTVASHYEWLGLPYKGRLGLDAIAANGEVLGVNHALRPTTEVPLRSVMFRGGVETWK